MHRKSAQGNGRVVGEQPGIMFGSGAEKCGMGKYWIDRFGVM
jgi:hypothetical protein